MLAPAFAEVRQCFAFQDTFGQGEDDTLFFVEVLSGGKHRGQQQSPRLRATLGGLGKPQVAVDFVMFLVESLALADLLQTMFEWPDE